MLQLPLRGLWHADAGSVPDEVTAPVQYGTRIGAFVLYLLHYQLLPEKRLAATSWPTCSGVKLVTATIAGSVRIVPCASRASPMNYATSLRRRRSSTWMRPVSRIGGKTQWLHIRLDGLAHLLPHLPPSAAACWRRSPALSCMTTGSLITR